MQKVFITGCNKTGTTLMLRLFHSFEKTLVCKNEIGLERFCKLRPKMRFDLIVGKRNFKTIYSSVLDKQDIKSQLDLLLETNLIIINCIRYGEDVILSNNHIERYIASMKQAQDYIYHITLTVKYEELVHDPDMIQSKIETILGMKAKCKFSTYPSFVPEDDSSNINNNSLRPIETSRINKQPGYYKKVSSDFEILLKQYTYEQIRLL